MAGERLVERNAEAELIGTRIGRSPRQLLGGHVRGRTEHHARLREDHVGDRLRSASAIRRAVADEAEVGHPHVTAFVEHRIGGLEVAVNETGLVSGGQPLPGLDEAGHDLGGGTRLAEPCLQRAALHVLHRDEQRALEVANLVDRHDGRMHHPGKRPRLPLQACVGIRV